jgi:hypothetical protein
MFQNGYGETENKVIEMKENTSDFLELLLSLHPGVQKPIDSKYLLTLKKFQYDLDIILSKGSMRVRAHVRNLMSEK